MLKTAGWAKLDLYDYTIDDFGDGSYQVHIRVNSRDDVAIADLSTDITSHEGNIYVEGLYLVFDGIRVVKENGTQWAALISAHVRN